jgi:hypothetical protein
VTGVCYSDASPNPRPPSRQNVTSPYPSARTPNEVAPFEEPMELSPLAAAVFNAATASSSRQPRQGLSSKSSHLMLKKLIGGRSTDDYPHPPRSATSGNFSYPYTHDDAASFDSHQSRHTLGRPTSAMMEYSRQPGVSILSAHHHADGFCR